MNAPFKILSLKDSHKDKVRFSKELGESFKQFGFVGIKDHTIEKDLVKDLIYLFSVLLELVYLSLKLIV